MTTLVNTLYKDKIRTVVLPSIGGLPPRDEYEVRNICGYYATDRVAAAQMQAISTYGFSTSPGLHPRIGEFLNYESFVTRSFLEAFDAQLQAEGAGYSVFSIFTYLCADVRVLVSAGSRDPAPPVYITNYLIGWNAQARSIGALPSSGYVEFQFGPRGAMFCGLAFEADYIINADDYQNPNALPFAWRCVANAVVPVVYGAPTTTPSTWAVDDVFKISRFGPFVRFYKNDVEVGPAFTDAPEGSMLMVGTIYRGDDYVHTPSIVSVPGGGAELELPALALIGGEGTAYSGANLELPGLTLQSYPFSGASLELPALLARGSGRDPALVDEPFGYSSAELTLPAMTVYGYAGLPTYVGADLDLPPLFLSGYMLTGEIGGADLSLPALLLRGTEGEIAEGNLVLPAMRVYGETYLPPDEVIARTRMVSAGALSGEGLVIVVLSETGAIATVAAAELVRDDALVSGGIVSTATALELLVDALMQTTVTAGAFVPLSEQPAQVWVVNADTQASSFYEGYPFNSFAKIDGRYYGAKTDGVYLLEGDDDDGVPIQASASFGKQDWGSKQRKQLMKAYAGMSSTGVMVLKVVVNDTTEYLYEARRADAHMRTQRFDLGHGLRANFVTFELFNQDGCDFELDSIEFHATELNRKI